MENTINLLQHGIGNPEQNGEPEILRGLLARLRMRDTETLEHSERVVRLSLILGRRFGLNATQMKALKYGSLLHDIGKIGVPDSILRKPGRLTSTEWNKMREHPLLGLKMLDGIDFLQGASLVVAQHHERWDGGGYPFGLRGNEIDRNARIFAVADAFDAMTSDRVYHKGRSFEAAAAELRKCAGQQFDPEVVGVFDHQVESDYQRWNSMRAQFQEEDRYRALTELQARRLQTPRSRNESLTRSNFSVQRRSASNGS